MNDQAALLRQKMMQKSLRPTHENQKHAKTLAIVSGKGGVGKTNISVNLAIGLAKLNKKVLLFDMDIGMGNIYHLINGNTSLSIADFFEKDRPMVQLIQGGPEGISYIHGGSAFSQLFEWKKAYKEKWISALESLAGEYDFLLFDMGAGATKESLNILEAADEVLAVTTPEPTAMTDAYSMIKFIYMRDRQKSFYLVCNRVETTKEGQETANRLKSTMEAFLNVTPVFLGSLPEDSYVRKAVKIGHPFILSYPKTKISVSFQQIVHQYADVPETILEDRPRFIAKLRRFFTERGDHE
ncbi:MinD/ParA family protein [Domibacillus tundrae]|uniref:MinD/ParA family protein n=1 Tax=Domibacillus tundrae TaxID=1587527 RepID=UPI000617BB89|nr:MinD/ParA family protein [Domibacillus tundrae]